MGYSIKIGKIDFNTKGLIKDIDAEDTGHCFNYHLDIIPCEGKEPEDLTKDEFTISKGSPTRDPSYTGWADFMSCCQPLIDIKKEAINPNGSDGWCYALNTNFIKQKIKEVEKEIPTMSDINQDRAKWLCFWVKEAIKKYKDKAAIGFW